MVNTEDAASEQDFLPELLIRTGEEQRLGATRHEYSKVTVQSGAVLRIEKGSREAFQIICKGDMEFHGTIIALDFSSDERTRVINYPDARTFECVYRNQNRGGDGGQGTTAYGGGGRGARGTKESGGGGGGGGSAQFRDGPGGGWHTFTNGEDATNVQGANGGHPKGGIGGDGADRARHCNGGIVYLIVKGNFDGTGGRIEAFGSNGPSGQSGSLNPYQGYAAGREGGGGGGAPGGQGGFVAIYVEGVVKAWPEAPILNGGAGGRGGSPNGGWGEAGDSGAYEFRTPRDTQGLSRD